MATDLVDRAASSLGVASFALGSKYIHGEFGGFRNSRFAFFHGFNILSVDERHYLVDPTFGQFVDPKSLAVKHFPNLTSGDLDEHNIGYGLIRNGYITLDNQGLRDYLSATTAAPDKSYIDEIRIEDVLGNEGFAPLIRRKPEYLDQLLTGRAFIIPGIDADDWEVE